MRDRAAAASQVLAAQESFWKEHVSPELADLLRYSFFLGLFPFAGYLFSYTVRGTIWSYWPFIQTTVDVGSALIYSALQWVLFAVFPVLCGLILEALTARSKTPLNLPSSATIVTFSLTPLCLSALLIGVPFLDRITSTLGFATFLFLIYYGFRLHLRFTIVRSLFFTFLVSSLFAVVRELFVFAIGV